MLTQERVRELFDYREDGSLIWKVSRQRTKTGDVAGGLNKDGYRRTVVDRRLYYNHRLVFLWHNGYLPENGLDHIDRNPDNNSIENLREVGKVCNARNAKVRKSNTSKVTGVSWEALKGRWNSRIMVTGKQIHLGLFQDFTEAVAHRLAAEQCLNWGGCHCSTSAYLYMQKYVEVKWTS